jgi:hypothetical protein
MCKSIYRASIDIDNFIDPLREAVFVKTKDTAVKQEIENNRSLMTSALKTVIALNAIPDVRKIKWPAFINEIAKASNPPVSLAFKELSAP